MKELLMKRRIVGLLLGAGVLAGCGGLSQEIPISAQNDSGRTGTATLSEKFDGTLQVMLDLTGGTDTGVQPAHIHDGTCASPGGVERVLAGVINGKSSTSIPDTSLAEVRGLIINVHNSADADIYVACGEIR
jgi:hypothetical protein